MCIAWPQLHHVFSVCCENDIKLLTDASTEIQYGPWPQSNLLTSGFVGVGAWIHYAPQKVPCPETWECLIKTTEVTLRPKVVLESWCAQAINWENDPMGKAA